MRPANSDCRIVLNHLRQFRNYVTRVHNPNNKSMDSAISAQLMAQSPYTLQWATLSPKIAPSHRGIWAPSNSRFLGPFSAYIQMASQSVQPFSHRRSQSVPMLYNGSPLSPKLHLPIGGSGAHPTHDYLSPFEPTIQTASRSIQQFLHRRPQNVLYFTMGCPFPRKISPSHGGIWTLI